VPSSLNKKCTKCLATKPASEFAGCRTAKDGLQHHCKKCNAEYYVANRGRILAQNAEHYQKNKAKKDAESTAWRKAHPDRHRKFVKNWVDQHPEEVRRQRREWYEQNAESCRQYSKEWRAQRPEAVRVHAHNRRATVKKNGGRISVDLWKTLLDEQNAQCPYCFADLLEVGFHLDHFMPLALGGKNEDHNIQLTCPSCNWRKHDTHPADFLKMMSVVK
jgi:5-methylcytosine-specific restriction endonuclease McrA